MSNRHSFSYRRKMCFRKKRYRDKWFADRLALKRGKERNVRLKVYLCPICHGYHLAKNRSGE